MHSQASQLLRRNNRAKRKQAKAEARAQARSSTPLVRLLPSSAEDTAISKRIKFAPTASSGLYGAARVPVRVGGCSMRGSLACQLRCLLLSNCWHQGPHAQLQSVNFESTHFSKLSGRTKHGHRFAGGMQREDTVYSDCRFSILIFQDTCAKQILETVKLQVNILNTSADTVSLHYMYPRERIHFGAPNF